MFIWLLNQAEIIVHSTVVRMKAGVEEGEA